MPTWTLFLDESGTHTDWPVVGGWLARAAVGAADDAALRGVLAKVYPDGCWPPHRTERRSAGGIAVMSALTDPRLRYWRHADWLAGRARSPLVAGAIAAGRWPRDVGRLTRVLNTRPKERHRAREAEEDIDAALRAELAGIDALLGAECVAVGACVGGRPGGEAVPRGHYACVRRAGLLASLAQSRPTELHIVLAEHSSFVRGRPYGAVAAGLEAEWAPALAPFGVVPRVEVHAFADPPAGLVLADHVAYALLGWSWRTDRWRVVASWAEAQTVLPVESADGLPALAREGPLQDAVVATAAGHRPKLPTHGERPWAVDQARIWTGRLVEVAA